ncbi:hypothetical protein BTHE68_56540 [Burkholderia sp. THE68]|nr:hypothetical protein BTHE68_56540 [Burkholderia sp. THE68]
MAQPEILLPPVTFAQQPFEFLEDAKAEYAAQPSAIERKDAFRASIELKVLVPRQYSIAHIGSRPLIEWNGTSAAFRTINNGSGMHSRIGRRPPT